MYRGRFTMSEFRQRIRVLNERNCTTGAQIQAALNELAQVTQDAAIDGVVMILIEEFQQLQQGTPVDTGRAQAGWLITGDGGAIGFTPAEKQATYSPQAPNPADLTYATTIYVLNNVEYILALNAGWSKKQPAGFIDGFLLRVRNRIELLSKEFSEVE